MPKPAKGTAKDAAKEVGEDLAGRPTPEPPELVEIPFRGEVFTVPKHRRKWSTKGTVAIAEKQFNVAVKYLLGPAQWEKLSLVTGDVNETFDEFFILFGQTIKRECVE
jgi:hypothetical protein